MSKIQRGLKAAATLLGLLAVGVIGGLDGQGTLYAQHAGCSSCNAAAEVVYTQPTPVYSAPVYAASDSSCGCSSCRSKVARPKCGCRCGSKCSSGCDCQFCELEVKKGEVEKTAYKSEQKEVCIPAVRLPWKKCCPPKRSKVRTVNVLKKDKYKCPQCEYKWSVHEPEEFKEPTAAGKKEAAPEMASKEDKPEANELNLTPEELKEFNLAPGEEIISITSDPSEALGDVPRPPTE